MSRRKAVPRATATRYRSPRGAEAVILDELCATTGWHRDHARKAASRSDHLGRRRLEKARPPTSGEDVMAALWVVWAVMDAPAGKRMAPFLTKIVGRLRVGGELGLDDGAAVRLGAMSAATIGRRLASSQWH